MNDTDTLDEHWIVTVCKFGQGADTCRYLIMAVTDDGFSCAKLTRLKTFLDEAIMTARGDNCEGVSHDKR
jgi:hypothetical protein